jgi:Zn-dependent protease with chaperone function
MRTLLRALLAVVMLAGFYVLALGIAGGLTTLDVYLAISGHIDFATVKLLVVTLPVILTVLSGVLMIGSRKRHGEEEPEGVVAAEAGQPDLWAAVRRIAGAVGTRPPDEIRLVSVVNAGVSERSRLLGLIPGRRLLIVGVPLLAGLTEREFESVLAHEFGHYANRDTRLSGITYRGRAAIIHTLTRIGSMHGMNSILGRIFTGYAKLYFRVSEAVCRRQELAADAASVRVAGRDATVAALGKIRQLAAAWGFYQARYVGIGVGSGLLPRDVVGGFSLLLADPERQSQLRRFAEEAPPEEESPYDSHPPISRRIALVAAGDPGPAPTGPDRPATALLRDAGPVLESAYTEALNEKGRALKRLEWNDFMHATVRAAVTDELRKFLAAGGSIAGGASDLRSLLAALAAGRAAEIGERLAGPDPQAATPQARREAMLDRTRANLGALVIVALADAGRARWEVSWSEQNKAVTADGRDLDVKDIVVAATAETPDVEPMRRFLAEAGVPDDYRL